jgi:hypothetical protein
MNIKTQWAFALALGAFAFQATAATTLTIDAAGTAKTFSPYIYGKNGGLSQTTGTATTADTLAFYKATGVKMLRLNNGNNASKYNYEKHLTSHPDWYNNVYSVDWDQSAKDLAASLPGVQGMFAISMLGWAANDNSHNFNDWLYNGSAWWSGVSNNWAGTTAITAEGEKPSDSADVTLYLKQTTPDWEAGILTHFFGSGDSDVGLAQDQFLYWNMDNEPEIWNGTHDDVMPDTMSAEEFVQTYIAVAKKARALYPDIKLVGPVTANEWQWYYWHNSLVTDAAGNSYSFLEYFIKRIAEAEDSLGVKLLDVVDIHFYPSYSTVKTIPYILQLHRVWFDTTFTFVGANAVKKAGLSSTGKEYIFQRIRDWLTKYMGADNGVTLGISEFGAVDGASDNASAIAVMYASMLGEFAAAGDVELFTPWTWYKGMFETMHLFTHYAKTQSLAPANGDSLLTAYTTLNAAKDSMTVILVNRNQKDTVETTVTLKNFVPGGTWAPTFDLANLNGETFVSDAVNGIYKNAVDISGNAFTTKLLPLSVTAVVLSTQDPGTKPTFEARTGIRNTVPSGSAKFSARAAEGFIYLELPQTASKAELFDLGGRKVQSWTLSGNGIQLLNATRIPAGSYVLKVRGLGSKSIFLF